MLVADVVRDAAQANRSGLCATLGPDSLTFGALEERSNRIANALVGLGVAKGQRLAWWGGTSLAALPLFVAAARIGAVFSPLDGRLPAAELAALLDFIEPAVVVTDDKRAEVVATLGAEDGARLLIIGATGAVPGEDLDALADACTASRPAVLGLSQEDPHAIYLTSGSTGRPKGVVVSHRASWLRSFPGANFFSRSGGPGLVCMFPLSHFAGWNFALDCWQRRRPVHLVDRPTGPELLEAVSQHRANHLYGIPAVWERVLAEDAARYDCRSLRNLDTGTSRATPQLLDRIRERFPWCELRVYYGSTEGGTHTALAPEEVAEHPESVGRAIPSVRLKLSEDGEIMVGAEGLMSGYFRAEEQTRRALCDGFYRTGDVGTLDEQGYLTIVGRKGELIRTGGQTLAPAEVEGFVRSFPGVRDAAVVGLPDPQWGEVVAAALVLEPGSKAPSVPALRAHLETSLSDHKHPRLVVAVDAIPRTLATGQVQRSVLRSMLLEGLERAAADEVAPRTGAS